MSHVSPSAASSSSLSAENVSSHPLAAYGWDGFFADAFRPHAEAGLVPARIVRVDRGRCELVAADGAGVARLRAGLAPVRASDPLEWACTGDWAAYDAAERAVAAVLPRRTALYRSASTKRSDGQVLAANIDQVVVAVSLAVEPDLARVERFLALGWESGAQPVLVLTKADLAGDGHLMRADAEAAAPGVPVLQVSSATGEGVDELAAVLAGRTSVLVGQSGAGKSTLVNTLLGAEVQTVNHTRDRDGKGRHTTTARDLLALPTGGVVVDTPGVRGVGLWDAESGLRQVFAEIEELAADCRFQDCSHTAEPGCAVLAAVEDGTLARRRLDSYRKLLRENEFIASRTDARLRAERRRQWKVIQKSVRESGAIRRR
ncbi:ribosome small subunit-dependent GTPase A [Streptomyces capparidis]